MASSSSTGISSYSSSSSSPAVQARHSPTEKASISTVMQLCSCLSPAPSRPKYCTGRAARWTHVVTIASTQPMNRPLSALVTKLYHVDLAPSFSCTTRESTDSSSEGATPISAWSSTMTQSSSIACSTADILQHRACLQVYTGVRAPISTHDSASDTHGPSRAHHTAHAGRGWSR